MTLSDEERRLRNLAHDAAGLSASLDNFATLIERRGNYPVEEIVSTLRRRAMQAKEFELRLRGADDAADALFKERQLLFNQAFESK